MNKKRFDELINQGDEQLLNRKYKNAFEHYELALTSLTTDNIKDKRSKVFSSFAGWTAAFLTGGLGFEDLIIIPGVSKGVSKFLGVDDNYMNLAIQGVCMREIDCLLQSEEIRSSIPKDVSLQRFALLLKASNPTTSNMEVILDLFVPEMSLNNPFDQPEVTQSPVQVLMEEIQTNDPINSENLYLLYSYLLKINDASQIFLALDKMYGHSGYNNNKKHTSSNNKSSSNSSHRNGTDGYYEVFGIKYGASEQAIKDAYREVMKKYHPDRFSTLSQEFQDLANRKAQFINEAYEYLMKQFSATK
ncbi:MAG: J domain-containing protein [Ignavibacteriaceae bacterium]|nr:J domain-containing protein [Ignavibacteriaceae bacterium]